METRNLSAGITYIPNFVMDAATAFSDVLEQVGFVQRTVKMYGRTSTVPRREAWYGDKPYTFSGHTFPAQKAPPIVDSLSIAVEAYLQGRWYPTEGALVNLYENGRDSVGWHSDDDHGVAGLVVCSISLGAPRDMLFRRKVPTPVMASALLPNKLKVCLEPGSLLIMGAGMQKEWSHSIPKRAAAGRRANITFRGK